MNATLARMMRLSSLEGEQLSELDKAARIAIETGQVSLTADYALNPVIYARYKDKLEAQANRKESEVFKFGSNQIKKAIKGKNAKYVDPQGNLTQRADAVNEH